MKPTVKYLYILLIVVVIFPFDLLGAGVSIAPWFALFLGIVFALFFECPYPKFNKKTSKYLLQASVVGLGFGMNLNESLKSGSEGMMFTVVSVIGVPLQLSDLCSRLMIMRWLCRSVLSSCSMPSRCSSSRR